MSDGWRSRVCRDCAHVWHDRETIAVCPACEGTNTTTTGVPA